MKKTLFFISMFSLALFSCSDDDNNEQKPSYSVITFEKAQLAEDGTLQGKSYEEASIVFDNYYDAEQWYNSGYTVSNNTDMETAGFMNQYSVYAKSGADGSKNFLVYNPCYYGDCFIHRADGKNFMPKDMAVALTTYTQLSTKDGDAYAKKFGAGDSFTLIIKGMDADGNVLKTIEKKLIDYPTWWTPWSVVSLDELGLVNKILIAFDSTDKSEWGVNTPQYIAIDNFTTLDTTN